MDHADAHGHREQRASDGREKQDHCSLEPDVSAVGHRVHPTVGALSRERRCGARRLLRRVGRSRYTMLGEPTMKGVHSSHRMPAPVRPE